MAVRLTLVLVFVGCLLSMAACAASSASRGPSSGFDHQYQAAVKPYSFDFARWELETLRGDILQRLSAPLPEASLTSNAVVRYFSVVEEINSRRTSANLSMLQKNGDSLTAENARISRLATEAASLLPAVEQTLGRQFNRVLADQGIYNPFSERLKLTFPAVRFKLEKPLNLVVVSPRDKIERLRDTVVRQDITPAQSAAVESSLEGLNTSALVIPIGGLGATYPSFVSDDADLRFTLDTVAEEWLHQYLAFKPLGRAYVLDLLGISKNADIATLNETVAGVAAQELGSLVYNRYYAGFYPEAGNGSENPSPSDFDFNAAMRETRQQVDRYLAQGQVETAEQYMRDRRQYLAENGYYLHKLNQAYFAFYGSYAYSPISIDPVGEQVKSLRKNRSSLKTFLEAVSGLNSRQDLDKVLENLK